MYKWIFKFSSMYYIAIKVNELWLHAIAQINFINMILTKRNLTQTNTVWFTYLKFTTREKEGIVFRRRNKRGRKSMVPVILFPNLSIGYIGPFTSDNLLNCTCVICELLFMYITPTLKCLKETSLWQKYYRE